MNLEKVEWGGETLALVIYGVPAVSGAKFFTPDDAPLQLGILQRQSGYSAQPHRHKRGTSVINAIHEVLYIERGKVEFDLYSSAGKKVRTVALTAGDTILLIDGGHGYRATEDFRAVIVKQGPHLGEGEDKEFLEIEP